MSLWSELRRRNVVKVATAYLIVAWLLAQVASVFAPALILPEWAVRFVVFVLILGFPIALLLAWAYELTPEGIKRTKNVPAAESVAQVTGQKLNYVLAGLLVLAVSYIGLDVYILGEEAPSAVPEVTGSEPSTALPRAGAVGAPPEARPKIAVLPCDNLSPDADDAYFALGIHDEILNQLAKIHSILVVARTSVLRYASPRPPIPQIARELGATSVMDCSARYAGDGFVISAQLIDPATDSNVWSERYVGDRSNVGAIFAMQADIAMNIVNALEAELLPNEQRAIANPRTDSAEAYALYLRALTIYRQGGSFNPTTPPGVRANIQDLLDQALVLDPEFAAAHALKAWIYNDSLQFDPVPVASWVEAKTRAIGDVRRHAEAALALDPALALAHAALGRLEILAWRRQEAAARLARARELSPNDPETWQWSGFLGWLSQDWAEGLRYAERAVAVDPENPASYSPLAMLRFALGEYAPVAAAGERYIELNPAATLGYMTQARAALALGDRDTARAALQISDRVFSPQAGRGYMADLAYGHGRLGEREAAQRIYDLIQTIGVTAYVGPEMRAYALLAIGEHDAAIEQIELTLRQRTELHLGIDPFIATFIRDNAWSDPVLEEPRFVRLRERLGDD